VIIGTETENVNASETDSVSASVRETVKEAEFALRLALLCSSLRMIRVMVVEIAEIGMMTTARPTRTTKDAIQILLPILRLFLVRRKSSSQRTTLTVLPMRFVDVSLPFSSAHSPASALPVRSSSLQFLMKKVGRPLSSFVKVIVENGKFRGEAQVRR
jgi:hypothetical protein